MTGAVTNEPEYNLKEDDNFINITIPAPLSRPDSAAIVLEGNMLTFDTHPYLLKLKLPSKVLDDYSDVKFDGHTGTYIVKLKKDLSGNVRVEEEGGDETYCEESELIFKGLENEKTNENNGVGNQFYGFGNLYSKMFGQHYDEFSDVFDVPEPDKTDPEERRKLKNKDEQKKWDVDYYLADTMEPENSDVNNYLNYNPFWNRTPLRDDLSDDEKDVLENLTKKDWMKSGLSDEARKICELQMIDILFAYVYNKRVTEGDNTVTSAWNITKLSSTLSWFEVFENVKEVLISCYKRCLTYPLCRNWDLAETVKNDVATILNLGPKVITRCFLEVRDIFNETDNYYVLNTLYINDLAQFAYNMDKERAVELSREVEVEITKYEVNLELPLLEVAAYLVLEENKNENGQVDMSIVIEKLARLGMNPLNINEFSGSGSESSDSDSSEESNEIPEGNNDLPDDSDEGDEEESTDDDFSGDDESDDDEEGEEECEEEEEWESYEDEEDEDEDDDDDEEAERSDGS